VAMPSGEAVGDGKVEVGGKPSGLHENGLFFCRVSVWDEKLRAGVSLCFLRH